MSDTKSQPLLIPHTGERSVIVGQTGSGKTAFAVWLLRRLQQSPIIIYDTKDEPKFSSGLKHSTTVGNMRAAAEAINKGEHDYIVVRPSVHALTDPDTLDEMLMYHHLHFHGLPAYIDEAYSFHNGGRAGPGLVALFTRGRSKGQTAIVSTQRPAWVSRFMFSEAQRFYAFYLLDMKDKMRLGDVIPNFAELSDPPEHGFYFFRAGSRETPTRYGPIKLDRTLNAGYTDATPSEEPSTANAVSRKVWI